MLATAPQLHNRIAGHFAPAPLPVPATPEGKQAVWGEAVFAAALFYQARLAHPDPEVAERAARAIFDLEKTRLRHGREVAGSPATKTEDTSRSRRDARGTTRGTIGEMPTLDKYGTMEPLPDLTPIEEPGRDYEDAEVDDEPAEFDERERAVIESMVRHERYVPVIEELRAKLESRGVESNEARRLATEAFRQMVGEELKERRRRQAESGTRTQLPARREIPSGSACRAETAS
jgi:hypothetical protein